VKYKRFIKFCEKFEGFWFEFDLKKIVLKKVWKRKGEKRNNVTFRPSGPTSRLPFPAAAHSPAILFLFSPLPLTRRPRL
jgi:hypothetical protein